MAPSASSTPLTATASAALPRAAATADSYPDRTVSSAATDPSRPLTWSVAASSAPGAVLAVEPDLEGLAPGRERGALTLGGGDLLAGLGQPRLDVGQEGGSALVLGVEPLLAGVEPGDARLERGEVVLGTLGPGERLGARLGEPPDLLLGGGGPAAQAVDLAVQARDTLATVGGGTVQPRDAALLLGELLLGGLPVGQRCLERRPVAGDLGQDLLLLLADACGLGLELGRVAPLGHLRLGGRVADALGREARRCRAGARAARRGRTRSPGPGPGPGGPRAGPPRGRPRSRACR